MGRAPSLSYQSQVGPFLRWGGRQMVSPSLQTCNWGHHTTLVLFKQSWSHGQESCEGLPAHDFIWIILSLKTIIKIRHSLVWGLRSDLWSLHYPWIMINQTLPTLGNLMHPIKLPLPYTSVQSPAPNFTFSFCNFIHIKLLIPPPNKTINLSSTHFNWVPCGIFTDIYHPVTKKRHLATLLKISFLKHPVSCVAKWSVIQ